MPAIIPLIAAGVGAAGSMYAAHKVGDSANKSAALQTQAANHGADLQAKAAADALAYQQEQARIAQQQFSSTERANYDQWAAGAENSYAQNNANNQNAYNQALTGGHNTYAQYAATQGRLGTLGEQIGMGSRYIPPWEDPPPLVTPGLNIPGYQSTAGGLPGMGGSPETAFIQDWQRTHAPSEGPAPLIAAMKAKGFNVAPYLYGKTPSNNEISLNGQKFKVVGGENTPAAYWYTGGYDGH